MIQSVLSPIVQKYGGSSLSSLDKVRAVARKIIASRDDGRPVVVVVSAMGNTTSELIERARKLCDSPPRRELDVLLSSGERMSTALLAMALEEAGQPAISLTGPQSGIRTDANHTSATITDVRPGRVLDELSKGQVVIVAGFQGLSPTEEVTTLGRGGSDTTAVAIAGAIRAAKCEIYSDVAGVFTADPRIVETPLRLEAIDSALMSEYALHGARVLHPRCLGHAHGNGVTIVARSTFDDGPWTEISPKAALRYADADGRDCSIVGVTSRKHRVQVAVHDETPDVIEAVKACAEDEDGILRARRGAFDTLLLDVEDAPDPEAVIARLRDDLGAHATVEERLASVTVVAEQAGRTGLEVRAEDALREAGVPVEFGYQTAHSTTFAIPTGVRANAVRVLHAALVESTDAVGV